VWALALAPHHTVLLGHCNREDLCLYALLTERHMMTPPVGPADAIVLDGDEALLILSEGAQARCRRLRR